MEIREFDLSPTRSEFCGSFQILYPTAIARKFLDDRCAVDDERATIHFQEKGIGSRLGEVHPTGIFHRELVANTFKTSQGEIVNSSGGFCPHVIAGQPLINRTAIQGVVQVARHAGVLEQEMRDLLNFFIWQLHVRHPSRRAAGMGILQKRHQAFMTVFLNQGSQRHGILGGQLRATVVAWRMASGTPPRMKQNFTLLCGHQIRRLQGKVVSLLP